MSARFRRTVIVIALVGVVGACGKSHPPTSSSSDTTFETSTTTPSVAGLSTPTLGSGTATTGALASSANTTLTISPALGAAGTAFVFTVKGFRSGEVLHFTITSPTGKATTGPAHRVPATGTLSATYKTASADAAGTYEIKASGDQGSSATGQFVLSAASHVSTTVPAGTYRTSTTIRR